MGWNGSDRGAQNATATVSATRSRSRRRILPVASIVGIVVLIGVGVVFLPGDRANGKPNQPVERSVPPAVADKSPVKSAKSEPSRPVAAVTNEAVAKSEEVAPTNSIPEGSDAEIEKTLLKVPEYERDRIRAELIKRKRSPIRGGAEQLIMMTSVDQPGDPIPPVPVPDSLEEDDAIQKAADAMLAKEGKVEEGDTETSIEIKEKLEVLKAEYAEAKAKGISFAQFLRSRQAKAEGDHETFKMAVKLDQENYNDKSLTDAEYMKGRDKINNFLNMQGIKPVPKIEEQAAEEAEGSESAPVGDAR